MSQVDKGVKIMYFILINNKQTKDIIESLKSLDPTLNINQYECYTFVRDSGFEDSEIRSMVKPQENKLLVYLKDDVLNAMSISLDNIETIYDL